MPFKLDLRQFLKNLIFVYVPYKNNKIKAVILIFLDQIDDR